jgi:transposase-like protein
MGWRRYSAEQWSAWIDEQRNSGQTISAFCGSIGVSENSFYVWRRKLRGRRDVAPLAKASPSESFVPLSIVESGGTGPRLEIDLPCGAVVRVPGHEPLIRQTLEVLLEFGAMNSPSAAAGRTGDSSC